MFILLGYFSLRYSISDMWRSFEISLQKQQHVHISFPGQWLHVIFWNIMRLYGCLTFDHEGLIRGGCGQNRTFSVMELLCFFKITTYITYWCDCRFRKITWKLGFIGNRCDLLITDRQVESTRVCIRHWFSVASFCWTLIQNNFSGETW